jgi:hypothetical protein
MTVHVLSHSGRPSQQADGRKLPSITNKVAAGWQSFKRLSSRNLGTVFAAMAAEWPTEYWVSTLRQQEVLFIQIEDQEEIWRLAATH